MLGSLKSRIRYMVSIPQNSWLFMKVRNTVFIQQNSGLFIRVSMLCIWLLAHEIVFSLV